MGKLSGLVGKLSDQVGKLSGLVGYLSGLGKRNFFSWDLGSKSCGFES